MQNDFEYVKSEIIISLEHLERIAYELVEQDVQARVRVIINLVARLELLEQKAIHRR